MEGPVASPTRQGCAAGGVGKRKRTEGKGREPRCTKQGRKDKDA